ncbi:MAG TPA: hypothetical protein VH439_12280, partial [Gemmatimonadales bacterium]
LREVIQAFARASHLTFLLVRPIVASKLQLAPEGAMALAEGTPQIADDIGNNIALRRVRRCKTRKGSEMSVRIANSRGIPGTLGCLARTVHQRRSVFLTSCHVMFAAGAARHDPVWLVRDGAGGHDFQRLGRAWQGKRGIVNHRGSDYFVDCAIGALDVPLTGEAALARYVAPPKPGDLVTKTGAATGRTTGVIIDSSYCGTTDSHPAANRSVREPAPRQLLIRSIDPRRPFALEGDSGALISNEDDAPIGLLWGTTVAAEGVACPIDPVLHALNIQLYEPPA